MRRTPGPHTPGGPERASQRRSQQPDLEDEHNRSSRQSRAQKAQDQCKDGVNGARRGRGAPGGCEGPVPCVGVGGGTGTPMRVVTARVARPQLWLPEQTLC